MKCALFAALALVATGASAQNIQVTAELSMNGKVIEQFSGVKPNGQLQAFKDLKTVPYRQAVKNIGGKATTEQGLYQTGFDMSITPRISSDGQILYRLYASQLALIKMEKSKVGDLEIDLPSGEHDSFTQTMISKSGEVQSFPMGFDTTTGTHKYLLKITATTVSE